MSSCYTNKCHAILAWAKQYNALSTSTANRFDTSFVKSVLDWSIEGELSSQQKGAIDKIIQKWNIDENKGNIDEKKGKAPKQQKQDLCKLCGGRGYFVEYGCEDIFLEWACSCNYANAEALGLL